MFLTTLYPPAEFVRPGIFLNHKHNGRDNHMASQENQIGFKEVLS